MKLPYLSGLTTVSIVDSVSGEMAVMAASSMRSLMRRQRRKYRNGVVKLYLV